MYVSYGKLPARNAWGPLPDTRPTSSSTTPPPTAYTITTITVAEPNTFLKGLPVAA